MPMLNSLVLDYLCQTHPSAARAFLERFSRNDDHYEEEEEEDDDDDDDEDEVNPHNPSHSHHSHDRAGTGIASLAAMARRAAIPGPAPASLVTMLLNPQTAPAPAPSNPGRSLDQNALASLDRCNGADLASSSGALSRASSAEAIVGDLGVSAAPLGGKYSRAAAAGAAAPLGGSGTRPAAALGGGSNRSRNSSRLPAVSIGSLLTNVASSAAQSAASPPSPPDSGSCSSPAAAAAYASLSVLPTSDSVLLMNSSQQSACQLTTCKRCISPDSILSFATSAFPLPDQSQSMDLIYSNSSSSSVAPLSFGDTSLSSVSLSSDTHPSPVGVSSDSVASPDTGTSHAPVLDGDRPSGELVPNKKRKANFLCRFAGCPKTFCHLRSQRRHEKTHSGERPYRCPYPECGKRFLRRFDLKVHFRIHTNERPYQCTVKGCEKRFSRSTDLRTHERVHAKEKPFCCTVEGCTSSFKRRTDLRVHAKLRHSTPTETVVSDSPGAVLVPFPLDGHAHSAYDSQFPLPPLRQILRLFADSPTAPFSIHSFCDAGMEFGKFPTEWFGPVTAALAVAKQVKNSDLGDLELYVPTCGALYRDKVESLFSRDQDFSGQRSVLVIAPLRLGLETINCIYLPSLAALFRFSSSAGVMGGRPRSSLYFVGLQEDNLLFLDPHTVQPTVDVSGDFDMQSFFVCPSAVQRMPIASVDPSLAAVFIFRSLAEFDSFAVHLGALSSDENKIVTLSDHEPIEELQELNSNVVTVIDDQEFQVL